MRAFFRDRTGFLTRQAALGDVSLIKMGNQTIYFVNDPDIIRDVFVVNAHKFIKGRALQRTKNLLGRGLLTSEGAYHLRQRRMIQPAFHRSRIAEYSRWMVEMAERSIADWREGEVRDIDQEMMHLTLRIVAKTLFNAEVGHDADAIGEAMTTLVDLFNYLMLPFSEWLEKLPLPHSIRFKRARRTLDEIIYRIINERRRSGEDTGDLLSMLLMARDEEDGGAMTDEQVRDEALTLFLAGHETTANALNWTWYLLSQNPDAEAKVHDELDRVLSGRLPTMDDIPLLKYTEAVLAESMRLYPPAWAIGRSVVETHEIDGYELPQGAIVLMSPFVMHRDERFWNDPLEFRPERWAELSVKEAGQRNIYFPFGGGVRRCIGESFAWAEGILLIATIGSKWCLQLDPDQKIAVDPKITLRPKFGMKMRINAD
ncbi:MAG TPA: cytochrome P450 [Pyrinomonadaceae bacterium]|nr:cytochrome P450 [Pyrinomonadaceae bacterium]